MATTKIIKVRHLLASLKYIMKHEKTKQGQYIDSFECSPYSAHREMDLMIKDKELRTGRKIKNKSFMIIQSFAPGEVDPDTAFKIGKELAERYLKEEHQYVITTHIDRGHIHNHIVFNATNIKNNKQYNSKTYHMVDDLRKDSDELCREYGLSVIEKPQGKGVSQKEYYARKYERSYKAQLEKIIDNAINNSDNWQDFLKIMNGIVEVKNGYHISFRLEKQQRFTRSRTLGIDYSEESIKYRILNKNLEIIKSPRVRYIDKSSDNFKGRGNEGLRLWASKENIKAQMQLLSTMNQDQLTRDQIILKVSLIQEDLQNVGSKIDDLDAKIKHNQEVLDAHETYKNSYQLIVNFKKSKDKKDFKKKHWREFKVYDKAKAILNKDKKESGETFNKERIIERLEASFVEREILYNQYQDMKLEFSKLNIASKTAQEMQKEKNNSHHR